MRGHPPHVLAHFGDLRNTGRMRPTNLRQLLAATGHPLTERLLRALPGPAWLWIAGWFVIAAVRPRIVSVLVGALGDDQAAAVLSDRDLSEHVVAGATVALCFVGTRLLLLRAQAAIAAGKQPDTLISGMGSIAGPVALSAVLTLAWEITIYGAFPLVVNLIDGPLLFLILLPIATFVWSYGAVLVGLGRLGRRSLNLKAFPADRSLGLRPVGDLALAGFAVYSAALLLYIAFLVQTTVDIIIGAALLVFGVTTFMLSMWRLHEQMVAAKANYVATARELYAQAFEPLRATVSLDALQERAGHLGAAAALEGRAESIQEWPIDERATRFLRSS
jgi:hypothetical protein